MLGLILAYSVINLYKLLGDRVCGDCGPICLSGSPFPLVFPSAQEQFVAAVALIISSGI